MNEYMHSLLIDNYVYNSLSAETSMIETVLEKGTTGQQSELAIVEEMPEDLQEAQEPVGLAYADMIRYDSLFCYSSYKNLAYVI